jgi:hypothetical protein
MVKKTVPAFSKSWRAKRVELKAARRQNAYSAANFRAKHCVAAGVHYRTLECKCRRANGITDAYQNIANANPAYNVGIPYNVAFPFAVPWKASIPSPTLSMQAAAVPTSLYSGRRRTHDGGRSGPHGAADAGKSSTLAGRIDARITSPVLYDRVRQVRLSLCTRSVRRPQ